MKNKVYLAPSIDKVEGVFEATVEAEYGADCVEGTKVTLAHHGPRAGNPAPCNATGFDVLAEGDRILISHVDLDTIGGILALTGEKPEDPEFWKAAEFIDLKGRHHLHELTPEIQDKLNAYYCFTTLTKLPRFENLTDVTEIIDNHKQALDAILDENHIHHEQFIASGRVWSQVQAERVESCLVSESKLLRVFDGRNGTSCAAGYYSPTMKDAALATLSLNKFQGITLGLSDEAMAMGLNASQIMQTLYGSGAGGREGIAGTPRGNVYTKEDLMDAAHKVEEIIARYQTIEHRLQKAGIERDDLINSIREMRDKDGHLPLPYVYTEFDDNDKQVYTGHTHININGTEGKLWVTSQGEINIQFWSQAGYGPEDFDQWERTGTYVSFVLTDEDQAWLKNVIEEALGSDARIDFYDWNGSGDEPDWWIYVDEIQSLDSVGDDPLSKNEGEQGDEDTIGDDD